MSSVLSGCSLRGEKGNLELLENGSKFKCTFFLTFKSEMPYRKAPLFLQFVVGNFLKILSKGILCIVKLLVMVLIITVFNKVDRKCHLLKLF